ncbi:DMT family transporter [Labrenzia sp. PHM005]|uniref:DMT family transporter n=1 Tax=Labrenzia sp. PHM005 TaxID=2590016 RepID=UPI001FFCE8D6|nr:DMT family transporter [Labrenzia sp. PHM005]
MTANGIQSANTENIRGSLAMISAMALFAVEDMFLKAASVSLPVGQILMLFGLGGALVFGCVAKVQGDALVQRQAFGKVMGIRFVFELTGRLFYVLALALTPLSSTTVILQATPIFVVLGAMVFFGEQVGWRRWAAIVIGLIGVVIVLRPGADSFTMLSMLAFIGMLGFAGRDLASRAAPKILSTSLLGFYGFVTLIIAGLAYALWSGERLVVPDTISGFYVGLAVLAGVFAYGSLMLAMRTGDVSLVTPFRYSRLLFGVGLGVLFFEEQLDLQTLIGCAVIVLSGLFILARSNRTQAAGNRSGS